MMFRFAREYGRNPTSIVLNLNTLSFHCFSDSKAKGNLYTIVMERRELNFPQALDWIASSLGLEKSKFNIKIKLPFGGFYKNISKEINEPEYAMETYGEDILLPYLDKYNTLFLNDGINFETQKTFNVGYDLENNAILIPEYTLDGKLCGIQARTNDSKCEHDKRWWAFLPCSRNLTLYGYHRNYSSVQEKGLCLITESEKSVMKMHQIGCNNVVATCGCQISDTQAKHLKGLLLPKYIVAYDEGLAEEQIKAECEKLIIKNIMFQNRVGYIYDEENKYFPKDSKLSPCDMPKDIFLKLVKECTKWI